VPVAVTTSSKPNLPSCEEARRIVEAYASTRSPSHAELLPLLDAAGLALAEDLRADRDFPPFPRSTRDGFAVRSADVRGVPVRLRRLGEIKAGASPEQSVVKVAACECVEIMTGAPVPRGADAVVMVEHTERSDETITVKRSVTPGENVVAAGAEARRGDLMVARGTRINHAITAVAAAIGRPEVAVHRRPRVAILATGDEVIDVNLRPGPNQIRNSNSYSLAAQVQAAGGEPLILPVAHDEPDELALLLRKGFEADLLLITGGVSMGRYDLVEQVLASFEAKFLFTGALIQPGKPVVFGEVAHDGANTPFFGLPGNPVSTMVTFELFARPVLDALGGAKATPLAFAQAVLKSEIRTKTGLTRFLPARLGGTADRPEVELLHWHGSGDLMAVAQANCYIVVPPDRDRFEAGETITVLPL
jgi:molybdopterin molybdotransferase